MSDPLRSEPAVGVKDVAAHAGVSVGTVSNVLNRPSLVAEETRERVQAAMVELGFVRNESARQLRAGVSRTVAVVVLDVSNPFFTDVVAGAERVADEHDALVVVCNSGGDAERERRHLARLAEMRVMGVLITPVDGASLERLASWRIPVVLVDRVSDAGGAPLRSVAVDDVLGGRLAGEHLAGRGHRRVAFLGGPVHLPQVRDRLEGFRRGLRAEGADPADVVLVTARELSAPAGARGAGELLAGPADRRPTAVFCANDLLALGVLSECTRQGLRVPEDLAIVGYDDIPYAEFAAVPLTSVCQPREDLGRTAARMLLQGDDEAGVVFEPHLVVRASSGGP